MNNAIPEQMCLDTGAVAAPPSHEFNPQLGQWMTPGWAADRLVAEFFSYLGAQDFVLEPSCGTGAFLAALPQTVPGVGVEIDPVLAAKARRATGRDVLTADIATIDLPDRPTAVIGNPPFRMDFLDMLLERCRRWFRHGEMAGLVLPTYALQTPGRILRYRDDWSIRAEHIPRSIFPRLRTPLVFALFERGGGRLFGFALYEEAAEIARMRREYRQVLASVSRSKWKTVVVEALIRLGGEAPLQALYREIQPNRPTANAAWREKTRQIVQAICTRVGPGRYRLSNAFANGGDAETYQQMC